MKTSFVAAGCAALLCSPLAVFAQQATPAIIPPSAATPTPNALKYGSGPVFVEIEGGQKFYTVGYTQPKDSKLIGQKIELRIEGFSGDHTFTHTLVINTGKFKTVVATEKLVADIFRRFLAGPVAAGQEFGQIGNINLGGELHFVAESVEQLNYKFVARDKPDSVGHFSHADVQTFLPLLAGTRS